MKNRLTPNKLTEAAPTELSQIVWDPVGKWEPRYKPLIQPDYEAAIYGEAASYQLAALFLEDCKVVEDWGCGFGTFRKFCLSGSCIGLDGSDSLAADRIVDLREYASDVEGILLRHVLEHNPDGWRRILLNALASFSKKLVLVFYTPFGDVTRNIRKQIPPDTKVPVAISFRNEDITSCFPPTVSWFTIVGKPLTEYETMFFLRKGTERSATDASRQAVSYFPEFDGDL